MDNEILTSKKFSIILIFVTKLSVIDTKDVIHIHI